jgi:hypothetical protein
MMHRLALVAFVFSFVSSCTCAPGVTCSSRKDCTNPQKPYCAPALGMCVECIEDAMCEDGFICNADGQCEAGCRDQNDRCSLGRFCLAG